MINLYLTNGDILLYNADDWLTLRKEHRIIGEIVGNSLHVPSLPIRILPEEACLLLDKKLVTIFESPKEITKSASEKRNVEEYENNLLEAQTVEYKKARREQLESVADQIIAKQTTNKSKEEIVNEELAKFPDVTKNNMIWPVKLSLESDCYKDLKTLSLSGVLGLTTEVKSAVYSDLWNRGYYISQGDKFGGHFLVYAGDPVCHHALFIVRCTEASNRIFPMDLLAFGRLGTSVKKRSVWASVLDGKVSYVTMSWMDA